jgi:hypothetical protein
MITSIVLTILAFMCLLGQYFVQKRNRIGIALWIFADFWWTLYDVSIGEYIQATLWGAYFLLSIYGWFTWNSKSKAKVDKPEPKCCVYWKELDDDNGNFEYCRYMQKRCSCCGEIKQCTYQYAIIEP